MPRNVIIVIQPGFNPEPWGNFKKMCEAKKLPYHYLKQFKFPIKYKGWEIYKMQLK